MATKTDATTVYAITGPGELFLDEWLASNSSVTLVEANADGLAELRRLIAEQGVAVEIAPAAPGYYPDDWEGGVMVLPNGTWREAADDESRGITEDRDDTRRGLAQHTVSGEHYIVEYCALRDAQGDAIGTRIIAATGPVSDRELGSDGGPLETSTALFDRIDAWPGLTDSDAAWLQDEEDAGRIRYPIGVR